MKIVLYGTKTCPRCHVLEMKLNEKKRIFEKIDDEDFIKEKGILSVPVLEIDGIGMSFSEAIKWVNGLEEKIE